MERPILTKFGEVMRLGNPAIVSQWNFVNSTIQDGSHRHLEKSKNLNIFATETSWATPTQVNSCWCCDTLTLQRRQVYKVQPHSSVLSVSCRYVLMLSLHIDQFSGRVEQLDGCVCVCVWVWDDNIPTTRPFMSMFNTMVQLCLFDLKFVGQGHVIF